MRLSEKEAAILAHAEFNADAPISTIRKSSGYREHTIRYALNRLLERKVIAPVPFINLHRLGYTIYTIFFSTGSEKKGSKEGVLQSFMAAPQVLWIGEFGGEFQYGLGFCTKQFGRLAEFLKELSKKHPHIFFEKAVSVQISTTVFPHKYLSPKKLPHQPLTATFGKDAVDIDPLDERILSALTTAGGLSHRQIALKLQVPLSTLELRVKKLTQAGVIMGNIYVVDPSTFQRQSFKLLVYTKGLDPQVQAGLYKFCAAHPDITNLIDCLGSWGFEIGVEVRRAEDVTAIIQEIYDIFGGAIHTIKMLTKFRYPKWRLFPQVKESVL